MQLISANSKFQGVDALLTEADDLHRCGITGTANLLNAANALFRVTSERRANHRDSLASDFNIFRLTRRADYEVTTHQTIIADLLDPNGTHSQGNIFLKPFLAFVSASTGIDLPPADFYWEVDHNRNYIDVRLRHSETNNSVVIETKWNAEDRPGQVVDYWRSERERTRKSRVPLIFLTQNGRKPNLGLRADDHDEFQLDLVTMSFRSQFADMLKCALGETAAPRLVATLNQYIEILDAIPDEVGEQT